MENKKAIETVKKKSGVQSKIQLALWGVVLLIVVLAVGTVVPRGDNSSPSTADDLLVSTAHAEEESEHDHDHDHEHEGEGEGEGEGEHGHDHDHSDIAYLYGNHLCPACDFADQVDPHYFADISNKKANVYARVYLCNPGCAEKIKNDMGKYYILTYRTDRETGEEIEARKLDNKVCPTCDDEVDGKTSIEYNGMILNFCCPDCVQDFLKNPEPGMAKILPEAEEFKFEFADHEHDHEHEGE
jgi:YHS domain-containing protein